MILFSNSYLRKLKNPILVIKETKIYLKEIHLILKLLPG